MRNQTTRKLAESAIFIALATLLSLIKIDLPFGGGVTIASMLPIILVSHRWGWRWGLLTAFVYSLIQLLLGLDNLSYGGTLGIVLAIALLDYVVPYTVLGLSGVFNKPDGAEASSVATGIAVTFCLRFLCHLVTGAWVWGVWMPESFMNMTMTNPWVYSALYNGWYMLAELIVTEIIAMLLFRPLRRFFRREDVR